MAIQIGGVIYEVQAPARAPPRPWELLQQNGRPMTARQFENLPQAHRDLLAAHVEEHFTDLIRQRPWCWAPE